MKSVDELGMEMIGLGIGILTLGLCSLGVIYAARQLYLHWSIL